MTDARLRLSLVACGVLAAAPLFPWLLAVGLSGVDRSWLDAPAAMRVTVPVALGIAAVLFALHGLLLQRSAVAELRARLAEIEADPRPRSHAGAVAVGATATMAGAGVVAPPGAAGSMRVMDDGSDEEPGDGSEPTRADRAQAAAVAAARKQGSKQARKAQRRARSAAKREAREMFRDAF